MIAAHRIIKAQDVGSRTEPPSRIPEPGHRLSQQWLHNIGMKLPGQFPAGQDWIAHGTSDQKIWLRYQLSGTADTRCRGYARPGITG